jgi:hypothetical protein
MELLKTRIETNNHNSIVYHALDNEKLVAVHLFIKVPLTRHNFDDVLKAVIKEAEILRSKKWISKLDTPCTDYEPF